MQRYKPYMLLAAGFFMLLGSVSASAQSTNVSSIMGHLNAEYGIQQGKAPKVRLSVEGFFSRNGDEAWLKDAVGAFWESGCQQTCLPVAIRGLNRGMDRGLGWDPAFDAVNEELGTLTGNRDMVVGPKLTEQLRLRLSERIGDPMNAPNSDDRTRELERSMERENDDVQPAKTWEIRPRKKRPN